MVDSAVSIQATQTAPNTAAVKATPVDSTSPNAIYNNLLLSSILLSDLQAGVQSTGDVQASLTDEELLDLNAPTLSLLNEVGNNSTTSIDSLNAQQLQEIAILQEDAQLLEEATALTSNIPLSDSAITLDLSIIAQDIAAENITAAVNNTQPVSNTQPTLTAAQLEQVGQIIAPLVNEPLTPELLVQIQAQLTASQINPLEISLNTMFLVQNYMVNFQANQNEAVKAHKKADSGTSTVIPVSTIDKVATEDSAISG